jgi:uncharacterized protein YqeY
MLYKKIQQDFQQAKKKRQGVVVATLRLLIAAVKDKEIELQKRGQLTDEQLLEVVKKEVKNRRESIEAYQKGGRGDLVDKETAELKILSNYLPREISDQQLEKIIGGVIEGQDVSGLHDFGKVMGPVMAKVKGRADGNRVATLVRSKLEQLQ